MHLEGIVTCVGYGDFLAETLPQNLHAFDNFCVVTATDDKETIQVCRKHSVHCVTTNENTRDGPFNKYRMIQRAIDQIGARDWILHLDADIVLPAKLRQLLTWAHLDPACIYGADRQNI